MPALTRRHLVLLLGSTTLTGIAGCVGDEEDPTPQDTTDADSDDTQTNDDLDEPTPTPVETDPDDENDDAPSENELDDPEEDIELGDGLRLADIDGPLPTDPDDGVFVDKRGDSVVHIGTVQRDDDPQFVFDPPFVAVSEGATVRWENTDDVFHTVTSSDSLENRSPSDVFNETIPGEGDTFEWDATDPGIQHYYCAPHAGFMYGSVMVL